MLPLPPRAALSIRCPFKESQSAPISERAANFSSSPTRSARRVRANSRQDERRRRGSLAHLDSWTHGIITMDYRWILLWLFLHLTLHPGKTFALVAPPVCASATCCCVQTRRESIVCRRPRLAPCSRVHGNVTRAVCRFCRAFLALFFVPGSDASRAE